MPPVCHTAKRKVGFRRLLLGSIVFTGTAVQLGGFGGWLPGRRIFILQPAALSSSGRSNWQKQPTMVRLSKSKRATNLRRQRFPYIELLSILDRLFCNIFSYSNRDNKFIRCARTKPEPNVIMHQDMKTRLSQALSKASTAERISHPQNKDGTNK